MENRQRELLELVQDNDRACVDRGEAIVELVQSGLSQVKIADLTKLSTAAISHLKTCFRKLTGYAREMCKDGRMNADACYSLASAHSSDLTRILRGAEDIRRIKDSQRSVLSMGPKGRQTRAGQITDEDIKQAIKDCDPKRSQVTPAPIPRRYIKPRFASEPAPTELNSEERDEYIRHVRQEAGRKGGSAGHVARGLQLADSETRRAVSQEGVEARRKNPRNEETIVKRRQSRAGYTTDKEIKQARGDRDPKQLQTEPPQIPKEYIEPNQESQATWFTDRTGARVRLNLSAIARHIKVHPSHLSRVMAGNRSPSMAVSQSLAEALGMTVDQLFKILQNKRIAH